jgi:hypothetical protein
MNHRDEITTWTASTSEEPTWRDGLNNKGPQYLFLAVPRISRNGYKAVTYGKGKIKFYPSPEGLGLDRRALQALGMRNERDRKDEKWRYVRYIANPAQVQKVLDLLPVEDWVIAPEDKWPEVYLNYTGRDSSRARHPEEDEPFEVSDSAPSSDKGGFVFEEEPAAADAP